MKFTVLIVALLIGASAAEMFTAFVDLERLIESEQAIASALEHYIRLEEHRMEQLRHTLNDYQSHLATVSTDRGRHLNNPINVYLLIKKLTAEWFSMKGLMNYNVAEDVVKDVESNTILPSYEDLEGAAIALLRLQDTYNLNTTQISSGLLSTAYKSPQLSARDCFDLGKIAYGNSDHYHTVMWMQEALNKLDVEGEQRTIERMDILDHLAYSTSLQGNIHHALSLTNAMLDINPEHDRARSNKVYFERYLTEKESERLKGDDGVPEELTAGALNRVRNDRPQSESLPERENYEALCRGENTMNVPKRLAKLKCYYENRNNPRLLLSPMKVEVAFDRPRLLLYHDILSDAEMELIKTLASPRLRRATIQNMVTAELEVANYRISKSAWIKTEEHSTIARINQRFEDYTGLNVKTAEDLQVANYGLGGHYEPHFDFARKAEKNAFKDLGTGNRIATLLIYMTDVDAGGATAFPGVGARIVPRKGTGAFWFNLFRSGEGDYETRHAACPVLLGNKWVVNKWFHEHGQEFRRPCSLDPSE